MMFAKEYRYRSERVSVCVPLRQRLVHTPEAAAHREEASLEHLATRATWHVPRPRSRRGFRGPRCGGVRRGFRPLDLPHEPAEGAQHALRRGAECRSVGKEFFD